MSLLSRAKKILKPQKTSEKQAAAAPEVTPEAPKVSALATRIGLTPLLTEKSFEAQAAGSAAAFQVKISATKQEIARAVQEQYGTKVSGVRTARMRGKVRRRGAVSGTTAHWKKAYVKVEDIQKLQVNP